MDYRFEVFDFTSSGLELGGHCLQPINHNGIPVICLIKVPLTDLIYVLSHEVIHVVLWKLFGWEVSARFDNIAFYGFWFWRGDFDGF